MRRRRPRPARPCAARCAGVDAVVHLAAAVGVGQSMYEIADYIGDQQPRHRGAARGADRPPGAARWSSPPDERLRRGPLPRAGRRACVERGRARRRRSSRATLGAAGRATACRSSRCPRPRRSARPSRSVYALDKYDQERLCLIFGRAYGIPTVALRFFNVYGPRQALSNPYTGVLAIFASRLLNGRPPLIFEDGGSGATSSTSRDVARACRLALERPDAGGRRCSTSAAASRCTVGRSPRASPRAVGRPRACSREITGKYRVGDIRHCFADIAARAARCSASSRGADFDDGPGRARRVARRRRSPIDRRRRGRGAELGTRGGWSHERPARARDRRRPVLITGGAGFIGANLADRLRARGPAGARLRQPRAARRGGAISRGCAAPHGDGLQRVIADVRDADAVREAVARRGRRVPPRRAGRGDDQPRRPGRRLRGQRRAARSTCSRRVRRAGARRRCSSPRPTRSTARSHDVAARARGDRWQPARRGAARAGIGEASAARLPQPVRLLEGRAPTSTCSTTPAASACRRVVLPHELHLRPAPVRHRGPGLGRALPACARCAGRADHHLRRRPPGARRALRRRPGRRAARRPGSSIDAAARAARSTSAAARQHARACSSCSAASSELTGAAPDAALRRLAARRPALVRLGHARAFERATGWRPRVGLERGRSAARWPGCAARRRCRIAGRAGGRPRR